MTEPISRFYVYIKKSIRGPFFPKDAALQPGFGRSSLVCPEKALGQWREASLEPAFQALIETPPQAQAKPRPPMTVEAAEETASRSLLEKAINKNAHLEREVKELRKAYNSEKHAFEEQLKRKEGEVHALTEKLKRSIQNTQAARGEHPSWETLYKTLKKRSEEKLCEATQDLSEKTAENARLRERLMATAENADAALKRAQGEAAARTADLERELRELRSQLEEKDMLVRTLSDNIASLAGKNEEFQKIMFDERRDYEEQNKKFCEEIGRLRADLKWRDQETAKIREELFAAVNKLKEIEAVDDIKSREQEELYDVLGAKLKLLSGYFENLEARVKYAFRKA
ncbi:MAG: hypothetical protein CVU79_10000 [Elusimicrobia bacterium HGW-Elusimicrobia-3]|nr:MAG: hypothetical protein CVU79_10000 [Elusimicrobia bacterium HGW-Elusimicrobia-3]